MLEEYGIDSRIDFKQKVYAYQRRDGGALCVCPQSEASQNLNEYFI